MIFVFTCLQSTNADECTQASEYLNPYLINGKQWYTRFPLPCDCTFSGWPEANTVFRSLVLWLLMLTSCVHVFTHLELITSVRSPPATFTAHRAGSSSCSHTSTSCVCSPVGRLSLSTALRSASGTGQTPSAVLRHCVAARAPASQPHTLSAAQRSSSVWRSERQGFRPSRLCCLKFAHSRMTEGSLFRLQAQAPGTTTLAFPSNVQVTVPQRPCKITAILSDFRTIRL